MKNQKSDSGIQTDDRELQILHMIHNYGKPIGSWTLVELFSDLGEQLSTSTIGRILNHLDRKGYLEKNNYRGRTITQSGIEAIEEAYRFQDIAKYQKKLKHVLNPKLLQHYEMVLEARRAIEKANVRLAARNISDDGIKKLEEIEKKREQNHAQSVIDASLDIDIHKIIAEGSKNDVLMLITQLIHSLHQQSDLFDYMRSKIDKPYFISHKQIIDAFKNRDPDSAEQAIDKHIDSLLHDVRAYWEEFNHAISTKKHARKIRKPRTEL